MALDYPKGVVAVYDNGGKTVDRYTVYYSRRLMQPVPGFYCGRGMSHNPTHPQGVGMFISGSRGRHNGKRIRWRKLPAECRNVVKDDLKGLA